MADQKISELVLGTPDDTDVIPFVDHVSGTTKKATKASLKGDTGDAATVDVGSTTTGLPGTDAIVVNSGDEHAAIFDFTIPRGDVGAKGDQGDPGPVGTGVAIETPTGTVDGANTAFTVAHAPLWVMIDYRLCVAGFGYTYLAGTITVDAGAPPVQVIKSFYANS